jgi:hypothetical protein
VIYVIDPWVTVKLLPATLSTMFPLNWYQYEGVVPNKVDVSLGPVNTQELDMIPERATLPLTLTDPVKVDEPPTLSV